VQEVERDYGIPVVAVATLDDLMFFLGERSDFKAHEAAVAKYRQEFVLHALTRLACCLSRSWRATRLWGRALFFAVQTPAASRCAATFCRKPVMDEPIANWATTVGLCATSKRL